MSEGIGLLAFLGESADWLKDEDDVSIREHRLAAIEAFHASWNEPTDVACQEKFEAALHRLFIALKYNSLVPDSVLMKRSESGDMSFLPSPDSFNRDFESLVNHYAVNKFGIGEMHLLNAVLRLRRLQAQGDDAVYDEALEQEVDHILFLRDPKQRADNVSSFSTELQAHLHAVCILRYMRKFGMCDEGPLSEITREDQSELAKLMADPIRAEAGKCIPKKHLAAFRLLDRASALEAYARAHAANRLAEDPRAPEELFIDLRQRLRKLPEYNVLGPVRCERLLKLGMAAIVRAMAHVDTHLGGKMYAFLRNRDHPTHLRHSSMFKLLPNADERLRLVNLLSRHGNQNPMFFVNRFQRFFGDAQLRFLGKEAGFVLEKPETPAKTAPQKRHLKKKDTDSSA